MKVTYTARAPEGVKLWDRIRFYASIEDYRCVIWPPLGPYWCTGTGDDFSVIVAYFPHGSTDEDIKRYWPEAREIDRMQEGVQITYASRFPKPDWWIEKEEK